MDRLIIENVRCFRGRHEVPLAPLTILVGENSTGKSTLLAMARLAWDVSAGYPLNFNEEPFRLGSYDQIASSLGARQGAAQSFVIGFEKQSMQNGQLVPILLTSKFISLKGQPSLAIWRSELPSAFMEIKYNEFEKMVSLTAEGPFPSVKLGPNELPYLGRIFPFPMFAMYLGFQIRPEDVEPFFLPIIEDPRPLAFAPIRTSPQRTYDPVKEIVNAEGGHVPMVLANLRSASQKDWVMLRNNLEKFGRASGLFSAVDVRRLGKGVNDPFQLQVKIDNLKMSPVDVGYGVSQILPILVECLRGERKTCLLQQPEVHLHPRAQAELGSFLAFLAKQQGKSFIIETHSDYLVDRIRMDIREGKNGLQPEDVSLLYFERVEGTVKIHRLMLDKLGNIENAPPGYRKFILEEERRFLGI